MRDADDWVRIMCLNVDGIKVQRRRSGTEQLSIVLGDGADARTCPGGRLELVVNMMVGHHAFALAALSQTREAKTSPVDGHLRTRGLCTVASAARGRDIAGAAYTPHTLASRTH